MHQTTPLQHQAQPIFNRNQCNALPAISGSLLNSMVCAGTLATNPMQCPVSDPISIVTYLTVYVLKPLFLKFRTTPEELFIVVVLSLP